MGRGLDWVFGTGDSTATDKANAAKGLSEGNKANCADQCMESRQYKKPKRGSGKEKADDVPSDFEGERPYIDENGKQFADRLVGKGAPKGPGSVWNKIKKWGDRGFE
ncbi:MULTISPECIES: hypothetical protein [Bacteria]|uniref:hypothetical protein n=1 Tax=Bacteria TaxID=2 RepID=UPI0037021DC6